MNVDRRIAHTLAERGIVSEAAVAHAEGVQDRGFAHNPIPELLLELEYIDEATLTRSLADLFGLDVWDGEERSGMDVPPRAIAVRQAGNKLYYATAEPYDEDLRNAIAAQTRLEPVPLMTTVRRIRRTRQVFVEANETRDLPMRSEESWRREWEEEQPTDTPIVRLTNAFLLNHGTIPGGYFRIEAFDEPRLVSASTLDPDDVGHQPLPARAIASALAWRLAYMALAPPHLPFRYGTLQIVAGRAYLFDVHFARTIRGDAVHCRRRTPAGGIEPPRAPMFAELTETHRMLQSTDDPKQRETLLELALRQTERLGDHALLDRLRYLEDLAWHLDAARREREAEPYAEEGMELIIRHDIGGRAPARFGSLRASIENRDLERRTALLGQAIDAHAAPGVGAVVPYSESIERLGVSVARGEHRDALLKVDAALAADEALFGAPSQLTHHILLIAAEAQARLNRPEPASELIARIEAIGRALDAAPTWLTDYVKGLVAVAGDRHKLAIVHLERASPGPTDASDVYRTHLVAAALAGSLIATGQEAQALALAKRATELPPDAFTANAHQELERIKAKGIYR